MTPPFVCKFGSLDLAPYLRIGNDEGFDPYDGGGFEEPAFIDNPFGEGQGLANVDSRNREMSWPLYLNASTKDGLHTLVRQINQEIRYAARPLRVEWRDQDATSSTFYDVEFARFESNFKMRPSAQKWLAGVLRVWTKPYGHTATERAIGSWTAARGAATLAVPSIAGDVDAHLEIVFGSASYRMGLENLGVMTLVSVIPPGYQPVMTASAMTSGPSSFYNVGSIHAGATGALASTAITFSCAPGGDYAFFQIPVVPSAMAGRNRILLVMNQTAYGRQATVGLIDARAASSMNAAIGPAAAGLAPMTASLVAPPVAVPTINAYDWTTVDLGVFTADPLPNPATQLYVGRVRTGSWAATTSLTISHALVVPEDQTMALVEKWTYNSGMVGKEAATYLLSAARDRYVRYELSPSSVIPVRKDPGPKSAIRGVLPEVAPGCSQALFMTHVPIGDKNSNNTDFGTLPNAAFSAEIRVRERFTWAR